MIRMNCLIVDDEPLARKGMIEYVREVEFLNLVGECANATQAASVVASQPVDLLLLDIQMPRLSGIDFLKSLPKPPMTIFTTAFAEYALEGYALDVIDYLVKPVPFDRFLKAVTKACDFHQIRNKGGNTVASDYIFVKSNGKYERVYFKEILYIESMQNYVVIHLPDQKLIVYMTLAGMEEKLPPSQFMKVHKSFIVALSHVNSIDNSDILIRQSRIPISRALREEVMKRIVGGNLVARKGDS